MSWAVNKCGGKQWRTHKNWTIEVPGEGYPLVHPGEARYDYMKRTWDNWGDLLRRAAHKYDLPTSWLLAIASIETGFVADSPARQQSISSPAGAQGIMQLMPFVATQYGFRPEDRVNPAVSIDVGAHLLSDLARGRTGPELPHVASAYNAGAGSGAAGVRCSPGRNEWNLTADANYPRQAIQYNNAAIHYLNVNQNVSWIWALGGIVVALGAGSALYRWAPGVRARAPRRS